MPASGPVNPAALAGAPSPLSTRGAMLLASCYGDQTKTSVRSEIAKIGEGRTISKYRKDQIVFAQGDPADAVFYVQKGKVKVTVLSDQGKKRSSQFLERTSSAARAAWPDSHGACRRSRR
jgi:hypothetical protein